MATHLKSSKRPRHPIMLCRIMLLSVTPTAMACSTVGASAMLVDTRGSSKPCTRAKKVKSNKSDDSSIGSNLGNVHSDDDDDLS